MWRSAEEDTDTYLPQPFWAWRAGRVAGYASFFTGALSPPGPHLKLLTRPVLTHMGSYQGLLLGKWSRGQYTHYSTKTTFRFFICPISSHLPHLDTPGPDIWFRKWGLFEQNLSNFLGDTANPQRCHVRIHSVKQVDSFPLWPTSSFFGLDSFQQRGWEYHAFGSNLRVGHAF